MKKVLCGLVIALMMTGSGHAYEDETWKIYPEKKETYCSQLYRNSIGSVNLEYQWLKRANEISPSIEQLESEFLDLKKKDSKTEDDLVKIEEIMKKLEEIGKEIDEIGAKQLEQIKLAHYYAVTWSALCD